MRDRVGSPEAGALHLVGSGWKISTMVANAASWTRSPALKSAASLAGPREEGNRDNCLVAGQRLYRYAFGFATSLNIPIAQHRRQVDGARSALRAATGGANTRCNRSHMRRGELLVVHIDDRKRWCVVTAAAIYTATG